MAIRRMETAVPEINLGELKDSDENLTQNRKSNSKMS